MKTLLITGMVCCTGLITYAQDTLTTYPARPTQPSPSSPTLFERDINYPNRILREELDFELTPVSQGKFRLNITTQNKGFFFIKVYDVIGNLLYEEKVRVRGSFQQELDMSDYSTDFFIIEIGNEEFNKTKSIVAT